MKPRKILAVILLMIFAVLAGILEARMGLTTSQSFVLYLIYFVGFSGYWLLWNGTK